MGKSRTRSRLEKRAKSGSKRRARREKSKKLGKGKLQKKAKPAKLSDSIPAVCSECLGDFEISSRPKGENVTCPVCGHVGTFEEGTFSKIGEKRQLHQKNFITALVVNVLALAFVIAWALLNSPLLGGAEAAGRTTNMITLGGGLVLVAVGLYMISKYEASRVEVYF